MVSTSVWFACKERVQDNIRGYFGIQLFGILIKVWLRDLGVIIQIMASC